MVPLQQHTPVKGQPFMKYTVNLCEHGNKTRSKVSTCQCVNRHWWRSNVLLTKRLVPLLHGCCHSTLVAITLTNQWACLTVSLRGAQQQSYHKHHRPPTENIIPSAEVPTVLFLLPLSASKQALVLAHTLRTHTQLCPLRSLADKADNTALFSVQHTHSSGVFSVCTFP